MSRLLGGLSDDQQMTMNYLMSCWEDRSNASAKDVFKVGLKLNKYFGKQVTVFGAGSISNKKTKKSERKQRKMP